MNSHDQDSPETLCPHCGAEATCHVTEGEEQLVEIICPDCGQFQLSVAEFEQAQADLAAAAEERHD